VEEKFHFKEALKDLQFEADTVPEHVDAVALHEAGYKKRYYANKFHVDIDKEPDFVRRVVTCYLEGMVRTMMLLLLLVLMLLVLMLPVLMLLHVLTSLLGLGAGLLLCRLRELDLVLPFPLRAVRERPGRFGRHQAAIQARETLRAVRAADVGAPGGLGT